MITAVEFGAQLEQDGFIKLPQFLSAPAVANLIQITDWLYSTLSSAETTGQKLRKTPAAEVDARAERLTLSGFFLYTKLYLPNAPGGRFLNLPR
jgi:hypothetical protein